MKASLSVQGFGHSPDEAVADLTRRCLTHTTKGWDDPTEARVASGSNPFSIIQVWGYVAATTLTKTTP